MEMMEIVTFNLWKWSWDGGSWYCWEFGTHRQDTLVYWPTEMIRYVFIYFVWGAMEWSTEFYVYVFYVFRIYFVPIKMVIFIFVIEWVNPFESPGTSTVYRVVHIYRWCFYLYSALADWLCSVVLSYRYFYEHFTTHFIYLFIRLFAKLSLSL